MSAPLPPATLGAALQRAAQVTGATPALLGDFGRLGWAELWTRVQPMAARLRALAASGRGPGSPLQAHAVVLRPDRDEIVVLLAHALAGIPLLPLHPALPEADAQRLADSAAARRVSVRQCLEPGPLAPACWPAVQPDDDLFWVPTSGSSGPPRLARLTHRAVLAAASALTERLPFGASDRWILTLPLSHVGGLSVVVRCLCATRPIVLVPRFAEAAVWTAIVRDGGTRLSAVPAIAHRLLADAAHAADLARLNLVMLGGQAAPQALRQALADAGVPAVASYGLTESCAAAACETPAEAGRLLPGCGTALRGMAIRISGPGGQALPVGVAGSIHLRGTALLAGYAGQSGQPATDGQGWLDTGDLGWLDEAGRLHVQGRRSEVIVTGGEKVVPGVVEAALREHPAVRDAVVFALPDQRWGAIVCAAVEAPSALAHDASLLALLATLLPPWARPRRLACLEALPRLNTGKVDRRGTPALATPCLVDWPLRADPPCR
ncbi:MAG: long-chain fatty acid--CoA ligase [Rubrivivax sp.]|nr:long-chain fatty acid--CoA ligase [Rubrivivax sp.]